jgi:alpha-ketoglutarate-dependent 2,4-dichlorophenoxyacetate dioxygenase
LAPLIRRGKIGPDAPAEEDAMGLEIRQLHPLFAAEIGGVDLSRPLDPATVAAIDAAMDRYAVLVFRGQALTQGEQVAMARQFGTLDLGLKKLKKQAERMEHDEIIDISNVDVDGAIADRESRKVVSNIANQLWHSDSSFQRPAGKYSMLHAVVLPSWGGETEFADLRAAYDALPDGMKAELEDKEAEHSALHSRIMLGDTGYTEAQRAMMPPVHWPLVRKHPGSGRKLLFVGVHAHRIEGMALAEGRMLLADLLEHATQRQFVHRHVWQVGDLVMWDNRSTVHRGRRYDLSQRRELRRTTTEDRAAAFESAA